jgi:hypothetical protein
MEAKKWEIEYDNWGEDGFSEWWHVTDGEKSFKCDDEKDAKWLQYILNAHENRRMGLY